LRDARGDVVSTFIRLAVVCRFSECCSDATGYEIGVLTDVADPQIRHVAGVEVACAFGHCVDAGGRRVFVRVFVDELAGETVERFLKLVIEKLFAELPIDDREDLRDPRVPRGV
jgi:hypothetical protein